MKKQDHPDIYVRHPSPWPLFIFLSILTHVAALIISAAFMAESQRSGPSGMGAGIFSVLAKLGGVALGSVWGLIAVLRRETPIWLGILCVILPLLWFLRLRLLHQI